MTEPVNVQNGCFLVKMWFILGLRRQGCDLSSPFFIDLLSYGTVLFAVCYEVISKVWFLCCKFVTLILSTYNIVIHIMLWASPSFHVCPFPLMFCVMSLWFQVSSGRVYWSVCLYIPRWKGLHLVLLHLNSFPNIIQLWMIRHHWFNDDNSFWICCLIWISIFVFQKKIMIFVLIFCLVSYYILIFQPVCFF